MLIQNMAAQKHVIKKYANRKLYDTQTSRYITLEGISKLVRDGCEIQVVERDSGRDLTHFFDMWLYQPAKPTQW